jgi:Ca-activated chloride channel family protein
MEKINLTLESEYSHLNGDRQHFNVHLGIKAPISTKKRTAQNIVVVVDTSGSMSDHGKLRLVKESLLFLCDQLTDDDWLSVVSFSVDARVAQDSTKMNAAGKAFSKRAIDTLFTGGQTNLSAGLSMGFDQFGKSNEDNSVASLIVFTDGAANLGITDPEQLTKLVANAATGAPENLVIHTIGYGTDYNVKLLEAIAHQTTGGMCRHVKNADMMPEVLGDCFGGLLALYAQNLQLRLTVHDGVAYNFLSKVDFSTEEHTNTVVLGDICFGEHRDLVLDVRVMEAVADVTPVLTAQLQYMNAAALKRDQERTSLTVDRKPYRGTPVASVRKHVVRVQCTKAMSEARTCLDAREYTKAVSILNEALKNVKASLSTGEDSMLTALKVDLEALLEPTAMANRSAAYAESASRELFFASDSHERQVGNAVYDGAMRSDFKAKQVQFQSHSAPQLTGPYDNGAPQPMKPVVKQSGNPFQSHAIGPYDGY